MSANPYKVKKGKTVKLRDYDTHPGKQQSKDELKAELAECVEQISKLQYRLYAENRQSLLIILQGMDSSGKDGTIKEIMNGVNPQGVRVHSFKHPTQLELEHDFLWRHIQKLPEHGEIAIFNRSHYENVLISRVHPELVLAERLPGVTTVKKIDKHFWQTRYQQINDFEKNIVQNGIHVIKFFLHISKEEQRLRFLERIENRERHWKFSSADITERGYWKQYEKAYEHMLEHTSTGAAPWHVIPADEKPFAHLQIAKVILKKLEKMAPQFPPMSKEEETLMHEAHEALKSEK